MVINESLISMRGFFMAQERMRGIEQFRTLIEKKELIRFYIRNWLL